MPAFLIAVTALNAAPPVPGLHFDPIIEAASGGKVMQHYGLNKAAFLAGKATPGLVLRAQLAQLSKLAQDKTSDQYVNGLADIIEEYVCTCLGNVAIAYETHGHAVVSIIPGAATPPPIP